jgi:hypothetical protein
MDAHFDPKRMPVEAVSYLEAHRVQGPVLSPDYWGGYLIYRLYPKQQVVVDDRHDLYGEAFFKSYLKLRQVEPGWQDFLGERQISCLLLPRDAALTSLLLETEDWEPIYTDEVAIAFVRSSSTVESDPTYASYGFARHTPLHALSDKIEIERPQKGAISPSRHAVIRSAK